jgi:hypothetical protein
MDTAQIGWNRKFLASYVLKAEQKEFNILKRPPAGK